MFIATEVDGIFGFIGFSSKHSWTLKSQKEIRKTFLKEDISYVFLKNNKVQTIATQRNKSQSVISEV